MTAVSACSCPYGRQGPVILDRGENVESCQGGVTLRQVMYRLVAAGLLPNTPPMYRRLSARTARARRDGPGDASHRSPSATGPVPRHGATPLAAPGAAGPAPRPLVPVPQPAPAGHARAEAELLRQPLPLDPVCSTNRNPCRHPRSSSGGRPRLRSRCQRPAPIPQVVRHKPRRFLPRDLLNERRRERAWAPPPRGRVHGRELLGCA